MSDRHPNELSPPPAAYEDPEAFELLRLWAAHGVQHVTLKGTMWAEPAAWGVLLVDLAKHAANSYALNEGRDSAEVLAQIREGFDAEWETTTTDGFDGHLREG